MIIVSGAFAPKLLVKNMRVGGAFGFVGRRLEEARQKRNVDILVIGSSHAYRGYDPRIFRRNGYDICNLGSSAQTLIQTEYLMNKFSDDLNPKFVIIDIYPMLLNSDGLESTIDLVSNGEVSFETVKMTFNSNSLKAYNTLIFSSFNNILHLKDTKNGEFEGEKYISGGYVETYKNSKSFKRREKSVISVSDDQLNALKRILKKLEVEKIPFVLVQSPFARSNYNSYVNNKSIDTLLSKFGPYYNFNEKLNLPANMHYDDSHVNQYGVNIFNKYLIGILRKEKFIL